jgi:hypothetical protein
MLNNFTRLSLAVIGAQQIGKLTQNSYASRFVKTFGALYISIPTIKEQYKDNKEFVNFLENIELFSSALLVGVITLNSLKGYLDNARPNPEANNVAQENRQMVPEIQRFLDDVRNGQINIDPLSPSNYVLVRQPDGELFVGKKIEIQNRT